MRVASTENSFSDLKVASINIRLITNEQRKKGFLIVPLSWKREQRRKAFIYLKELTFIKFSREIVVESRTLLEPLFWKKKKPGPQSFRLVTFCNSTGRGRCTCIVIPEKQYQPYQLYSTHLPFGSGINTILFHLHRKRNVSRVQDKYSIYSHSGTVEILIKQI